MWIYGPAGAGKSAIMQTIAEICHALGILGGSFFFFRTGEKRNIKTHLIATLAYQLTVKYPGLYDDITLAILRNPTVFSQTLEAQVKALIIQPIIAFLDMNPRVSELPSVILVDGLDECAPEESHREIITALSGFAFSPFRVIIGSRPEYVIRNTFFLPSMVERTQTLILDDNYKPNDDIRLFLKEKFAELKSNHPQGPYLPASWPSESSIATLVQNSSGQFIYAATVMKFVDSPRHDPIKALDSVLEAQPSPGRSETPFQQLDALYHHVLGAVQDIEKVLGILHCVMLARHIYDVDEVEALLGYSNGESHTVLCDMHSLLHVPEKRGDWITFHHTSLEDFLRDPLRARHLYISPPQATAFMASCFVRDLGRKLLISTYWRSRHFLILSSQL